MSPSETFEQVLSAAQIEGSFNSAWKKFVMTRFFVPVMPLAGDDPKKFQLVTTAGPQGASIQISEVRERLEPHAGTLASLYGADVIRMLHAEADILVALSDRAFNIARDRVEWLRKGIEASQAKTAAAKAASAPAPAPAPAPVPAPVAAAPAPETAAAADSTPAPVFDIAAIALRDAAMPELGIALSVPAAWTESRSSKVLRFTDPVAGTKLEVSGLVREGISLVQWQESRFNLIRHEMRHLTREGPTIALCSEHWRGGLKGSATEFTGVYPGDAEPSRYLLACFHLDGAVASIAIKAASATFEEQRPLYQWILERIVLARPDPDAERQPAAGAVRLEESAGDEVAVTPPFWLVRKFQLMAAVVAVLALGGGAALLFGGQAKTEVQAAAVPAKRVVALPFVKPWSPPEDSFVVDLPRPPDELPVPPMMRERASTFTMHQYRLFSSERIYGVQTFEYRRMPERDMILNSLEGVVLGTEGTLLDKRDVTFANGGAGREVRSLLPTGKVRTGRIAIVNSTGVVVMVTAHPGEVTDLHVAAVMNSFQPR